MSHSTHVAHPSVGAATLSLGQLLIALVACLTTLCAQPSELEAHAWAKQKPVLFLSAEVTERLLRLTVCLPKDLLNEVITQPIDPNYALSPAQQAQLSAELERYFQSHNPIEIDGQRALPNLSALDLVLSAPLAELEAAPLSDKVKLHSGDEGAAIITFEIGLKRAPQLIRLIWDNDQLWVRMGARRAGSLSSKVMPGVLVYQDELSPIKFTPEEPEHIWRPLGPKLKTPPPSVLALSPPPPPTLDQLPWLLPTCLIALLLSPLFIRREPLSLRLLGYALLLIALPTSYLSITAAPNPFGGERAQLGDEQRRAIFELLHQNIYRAFDYERDEEVYDALAQSVTGELLDWTFQEIYRSLILSDEGGARARVSLVKPLSWEAVELNERESSALKLESSGLKARELGAFAARYRWRVIGEVSHWGHSHRRVNDYEARYAVAHGPKGWRIFSVRSRGSARRPELEGGL